MLVGGREAKKRGAVKGSREKSVWVLLSVCLDWEGDARFSTLRAVEENVVAEERRIAMRMTAREDRTSFMETELDLYKVAANRDGSRQ